MTVSACEREYGIRPRARKIERGERVIEAGLGF
jgi:hypothetical protein